MTKPAAALRLVVHRPGNDARGEQTIEQSEYARYVRREPEAH
jgi:hypothetical protein